MRGKRYDEHHFCCIIGDNVIVDRQVHDLGIKQKSVIELDASSKERVSGQDMDGSACTYHNSAVQ